ncbi:MAG: hypothetical protein KJO23_02485 [Bacteroidia bacterium]|nr:hypothetical protein [Bacteroidia bacterium]NNM24358.1 hypothetical protein [Flavobacteriaceae bacterium]
MYHYTAYIKEVYDGCTVGAIVDLGFERFEPMTLKLYGVPKTLSSDSISKRAFAKDSLADLVQNQEVEIYSYKEQVNGEAAFLATLILDGLDVNQWLVQNQLALAFAS